MSADQPNPYKSPHATGSPAPRNTAEPTKSRCFHCVVGMWVSVFLSYLFGLCVYPNNLPQEQDYLLRAGDAFATFAIGLSLLAASYAVQLILMRRWRDIVGGLFVLAVCGMPIVWALEWWSLR